LVADVGRLKAEPKCGALVRGAGRVRRRRGTLAPSGSNPIPRPCVSTYLKHPNPTWPDIINAADWLKHDLGVSKPLWGDACLVMGRELAAVALAIVSTKEAEYFRTSPGGYFHGIVAKAKAGEFHLERTVWAIRRALQPERHTSRGRSLRQEIAGEADVLPAEQRMTCARK
jgi:hypothetical protein